jgi:hypothetical protein
MVGTTDKIYVNQTSLQIRLRVYEDLSNSIWRALIKYRKPNGFEGYWPAEIVDSVKGIIAFTFPANSEGMSDSGFWTVWAYLYYKDGTVTAGDAVQIGVYREGETYIAFPYGQNSIAGETKMAQEAFEILYNNTTSGLIAANVQDAIDELNVAIVSIRSISAVGVTYNNSTSHLPAADVQTAIDSSYAEVNHLLSLLQQTSATLYVDNTRVDLAPTQHFGTISYPYQTIADAINVAHAGSTIYVASGTYTEEVWLPDYVTIDGDGIGATVIQGGLYTSTTGNGAVNRLTINGDFHIRCQTVINDVLVTGQTFIESDVVSYNFNMIPTLNSIALTITGGTVKLVYGAISSFDSSAVVQTNGYLSVDSYDIQNASGANPTVMSAYGRLQVFHSEVKNQAGLIAIDMNNGATSAYPNILSQILIKGDIATGSAFTIEEGVYQYGAIPTGTNPLYRPASQISYFPPAGSQLTAITAQHAIDQAWSSVKSGTAVPTYTPDPLKVELYYKTDSHELYAYSPTTSSWEKVGLLP